MINLLPPLEKEKNIKERKGRVLIIFWFYGFFFLCVFSIILFFVDSYIKNEIEIEKILLEAEEKKFEGKGIKEIQAQIAVANQLLSKASSFYASKPYFSDVIVKISENTPDGIYYGNLSVAAGRDEKASFKFSLSGFAPSRESLFELKSNLESDGYFHNIDFPTSNWVKPENINFFASFEIIK